MPAGAPMFELSIDADRAMQTYDQLWAQGARELTGGLPGSFSQHPELSSQFRQVCGGNYFRGNTHWMSDWVDDGFSLDWLAFGIWDVDVRAEAQLYYDNPRPIASGQGTFSSQSTTTTQQQNTSQTQFGVTGSVGANQGVQVGPEEARATAGRSQQAGVSFQQTETQQQTITYQGQNGLSMQLPANAVRAEVKLKLTLWFNSTLGSPFKREMFTPEPVGHVIMGGVAGSTGQ
ncbi:MAG: hypothetical protein D6711_18375 [Chloroflexi bacterium]|nr:MAG: hypothetical protein D6711_18375 [Chloroflexota bacterium]